MNRPRIAVLGAGAWGTALAVLWAQAGNQVALWARDPTRAAQLQTARENARLPGILFPKNLLVANAFPDADNLVLAVPMQYARAILAALPPGPAPLVLCCKGLESGTSLLPPELAARLQPGRPIAILTGPNFAHEIAAGLPAAAILAADDISVRSALIETLHAPTLRLYASGDVIGAALGGAAKNVVAIAAGVVMGAGLGENARAALITRGLAEISRLATALGGRADTLSGLSGLGDLLLTCTGPTSRNFSLGFSLGQGAQLADILQTRAGVTEGLATAPALLARAQAAGVDMPLTAAVTALLAGAATIPQTMATLMNRALRDE